MSLIAHAKAEFERLGWPGECEMQEQVCNNVYELLEAFSEQGHSGTSAPYVINLFKRLAMLEPISPLKGTDDEWFEYVGDMYQNKHCSDLFKDGKDGVAYWSTGRIFREPDGCTYVSRNSAVSVEFPWTRPKEPEIVDVPFAVTTGEAVIAALEALQHPKDKKDFNLYKEIAKAFRISVGDAKTTFLQAAYSANVLEQLIEMQKEELARVS
ncbi:hypothetical protein N9112_00385 [bacterium]|nr:hypothetical protein [bacterium]